MPLGYKAKIGWAPEEKWGEIPPLGETTFDSVYFINESIRNTINRASANLINSTRAIVSSDNVPANSSISGDIESLFWDVSNSANDSIGLLLHDAFGNMSLSANTLTFDTDESSPIYPVPEGISIVIDRNVVNAPSQPVYFVYAGCKVNQLTISGEENNFVRMRFSIVGQREEITTTEPMFVFPTNPASFKFWFSQFYLRDLDVNPPTFAEVKCRSFEISINNNYQTDRYFNNLHPNKPYAVLLDLYPAQREITGRLEIEFSNIKWYEKFVNAKIIGAKFVFAPTRLTAGVRKAELNIPALVLTGDTPNISGRNPINLTLNFQVVSTDVSAPEIELKFSTHS